MGVDLLVAAVVAAVVQEVRIDDEDGVHMLGIPASLDQRRVVMHSQALQQRTR